MVNRAISTSTAFNPPDGGAVVGACVVGACVVGAWVLVGSATVLWVTDVDMVEPVTSTDVAVVSLEADCVVVDSAVVVGDAVVARLVDVDVVGSAVLVVESCVVGCKVVERKVVEGSVVCVVNDGLAGSSAKLFNADVVDWPASTICSPTAEANASDSSDFPTWVTTTSEMRATEKRATATAMFWVRLFILTTSRLLIRRRYRATVIRRTITAPHT